MSMRFCLHPRPGVLTCRPVVAAATPVVSAPRSTWAPIAAFSAHPWILAGRKIRHAQLHRTPLSTSVEDAHL